MNPIDLARLQFASTTIYHFIFVPLTLGLSLIVAVMQTAYYRTNDETYLKMTKFWGKLFLINFAMGLVTGIVQEFQFGMNWSEYSRFVGDIFGAPLAIEALMAFFIESTFLGLWIFGWDKLSKRVHLACIWLVAIAAWLSSVWILIANSFMQHPVGYEIVGGRAQMTDFWALITNENIFHQFPHVVLSGLTTGAFFVIGISAYRILNADNAADKAFFQKSAAIGFYFGLSAVVLTMIVGHTQMQHIINTQPMKLAVSEGLWESEDPAALSVFQIGDEADRESIINVRVPYVLSLLSFNTPDGLVQGINPLNEAYKAQFADKYGTDVDYIPPAIWLHYWSFRAMVGSGILMSLLAVIGLVLHRRGTLQNQKWFLKALIIAIILPYLANTTGWILTEVGRQPWIVYGVMRIEEAVSPNVTSTMLWISLIGFVLVYGVLMIADFYLLQKYARGSVDSEILPHAARIPADAPSVDVPSADVY